MTAAEKPLLGFIGQGWIGKSYSDDLEARGYEVIRYALEEPYVHNRDNIASCDYVFIAVPTPTTPDGFDDSIVREALTLIGEGKTAVIKSTLAPGTTKKLQEAFPNITVMHSPEFLSKKTAERDAKHPDRNVIGVVEMTDENKTKARDIIATLPKAPFDLICTAEEAELIKFSRNIFGYVAVVYMNLLYDLVQKFDGDWNTMKRAIEADPLMPERYADPIDQGGRGAGGCCFIKDFESFLRTYQEYLPEEAKSIEVLNALKEKNLELLRSSGKDTDYVCQVYGEK